MLPNVLSQALYGFIGTRVLLSADELGVFAAVARTGPAAPAQIAGDAGLSVDKVRRLLNAACSFGLLRKDAERYALSAELRPYLDPASPDYCGGLLAHFRNNTLPAFERLSEEIENTASPGRAAAPFAAIYQDAGVAQSFLDAMWNIGYPAGRELAGAAELAGHRRLVDVGGATGSFAIAMLERHPQLQATVFDLPEVAPYLRERSAGHAAAQPRLEFVPGDFWSDPLPAADLYAFGYIFSDWSDEDCLFLTRKAHDALPPGGRIAVLERLLDESGTAPANAVMQDMAMMMETGGRHRSQSEYEAMLIEAGFQRPVTLRSSGEKHIVAAIKPH